jgi:hypothetical protein
MTHIAFMGQAKITGNPHDNNSTDQLTFSVNITDPDKKGDHIQFSIIVTDSSGKVVYQKSGTAKGHIEIHKVNPDLLDSNAHTQDNDPQNRNSENDDTENSNSHSQNFDSHSQNSNSHSKNGSSHSKNNNQHSD